MTPHPDAAMLEQWLHGQLDPATGEHIVQHLEQCEGICEIVLKRLTDAPVELGLPPAGCTPQLQLEETSPNAAVAGNVPKPAAHADQQTEWMFLAAPKQPDEIGRLGSYRVLKVLGKGGMGVVFQAQDPQLRRSVALKAMLPEFAVEPAARRRFLREARAAAGLKHDHIIAIYHVGEERGAPFFVMELLEGESLLQRLRRGRLPFCEIFRIGREVAEGLAAAHAGGVIHRDIKPANIWLEGQRGRAIILDFGLARTTLLKETRLTQVGQLLGTPGYMAPEQITNAAIDCRCDLYSLGVTLYELTTGRLPFVEKDISDLLMAVVEQAPPEPRTLNPAISVELNAYILRLLAKTSADRPANAQTIAVELAALEDTQPTAAPVPPATITRKLHRRPAPLAFGVLAVLGMLVLVPLAWLVGGAIWRMAANQQQAAQESTGAGTTKAKASTALPARTTQPQGTPGKPPVEPAAFDDRQAAIWVLSTGGNVSITKRSGLIVAISDLPEETWEVNNIFVGTKKPVSDADLKQLKGLTKLKSLSLHYAKVSDAGLEHLKSFPALASLNLRWTQVGNAGMKHITALPSLTTLFLMETKVSDTGLEYLKPVLPRLALLELANTQVSDAGLVHLETATKLKNLNLSCKLVSDAGLKHLKTLTKLEVLHLSGSAVTGTGLEHLQGLTELKSLHMRGSQVNDTGLLGLKLPHLTLLDLGQTKITSAGLKHLQALTQLQNLIMDNNQVHDTGLEHLTALSKLQALNLRGTKVSDAGLKHLEALTNLGTLDLVGTKVTAPGVEALRQALPKCKVTADSPK